MITTRILIDLESIKENPNAGTTTSVVLGPWAGYCKIDVYPPDKLLLPYGCSAISERYMHDGISDPCTQYEIVIGNLSSYEILRQNENVSEISMNRDNTYVFHAPDPKFIYQYENTRIRCNNCKQLIPQAKIDKKYINSISKCVDTDLSYDVCPLCDECNTFEYEYETIEQALIRKANLSA